MAMSRILFKLKQANAPTRIAGFDGQPSWHDLASRITHLFNIPLDRVGVAFVDEAREPVILTGEQGLQDFYKDYQSSGKVKFVVRDLQTPDVTNTIASTWSMDANLSDLSQSGKKPTISLLPCLQLQGEGDVAPKLWPVEKVASWLRSKGFNQGICDKFTKNDVDGEVLLGLNDENLKSGIGIEAYGPRLKIMNAINDLFPGAAGQMGDAGDFFPDEGRGKQRHNDPVLDKSISSPRVSASGSNGKGSGEKRPHTADISTDILRRWSKKSKLSLPSISELPGLLDKPLSDDEKIPLTRIQFDNLLPGMMEAKDRCHRDDVERLFRVSDSEASDMLYLTFYNAVVQPTPPEDGTEPSFISFWDYNIRRILELLVPTGKSIRDSSCHTSTQKSRPDYGFLKNNVCPFRGEEKPPESRDDPKAELSEFTWTYSPAPYVFGYYATGPDLTLTAICAPPTPSQEPVVLDLISADLRLKCDRIANLCRLINLSAYLSPLLKLIGYRDVPEFTVIQREGKSVEIRSNNVKKFYHGNQGAERVQYIKTIYRQLQVKEVPHVDVLTHVTGSTIYVEPKGIAVRPSNEKELLDAIICVLLALQVLHQAPPLFHRDIRWPNVLRRADDDALWFLIDWDDAVGPNNVAANHFCQKGHSPRVFMDNHGAEVDIWGVGNLILESTRFTFDLSPELVKLGKWMQDAAPDAQGALMAVNAYAQKKAF